MVISSAAASSAVPRHRLIALAETEGSMDEEESFRTKNID